MKNIDLKTVESFGDEWTRFDQSIVSVDELKNIFEDYFHIFPWALLNDEAEGFDMGCGTGRWAYFVAPKVAKLNCIDPSVALDIARKKLVKYDNVSYICSSVEDCALMEASQDFGYSLGVLHHIPDTCKAIKSCAKLLKKGAPFLLYLYYAFDNRPLWYRIIWRLSDFIRAIIYRLPPVIKNIFTDFIALVVYWPLAKLSYALDLCRLNVDLLPLSYYKKSSFYTMRTDSRDRFGTPLEQRFTKKQIESMLRVAGFTDIKFSSKAPYWCAVGIKS